MSKAPLALLLALVMGGAHAATFTGTVFEDVNYGGGAGRSQAASGGVGLNGVTVELYRASTNAFCQRDHQCEWLLHAEFGCGQQFSGASARGQRIGAIVARR